MSFVLANFAVTSLVQDLAADGTTLYFDDADDVLFPALSGGNKLALVLSEPTETNYPEVVYATAIASGVMTVERGQEGTSAQDWLTGSQVNHTLTAATIGSLIGLDPVGDYDAGTTYQKGQIVTHNGVAYIATGTSLGSTPADGNDDWQVVFALPTASLLRHGNCRLTLSGGNILLSRQDGDGVFIDGELRSIPAVGVTLAPPATTGIVYNIYARMSGGAIVLEYSTDSHAVDAATGVRIKAGDSTRTLVGKARTLSNAWQLVSSYFNRRNVARYTSGFAQSTAATVVTELASAERIHFLSWEGDDVNVTVTGYVTHVSDHWASTFIYVDGASVVSTLAHAGVSKRSNQSISMNLGALAEGYHYMGIHACNDAGSSGATWTVVPSVMVRG